MRGLARSASRFLRPYRLAIGPLDCHTSLARREALHSPLAIDRHRHLLNPLGHDALDGVLPKRQPVGVAGGKIAGVQGHPGEPRDLSHLPLRKEPISDSTLLENLDGA